MKIKRTIQKAVENLTNRKCENCKYKYGFWCKSPKGLECGKSIFPIGWEKKGGATDTNVGSKTKGGASDDN